MHKFYPFGREIYISDEDFNLLEKFGACLNDVVCQHYLDIYFVYHHRFKNSKMEIEKYTKEELSQIVVDIAKEDVVI